jgi:GTP-binding protein Era
VTGILTRPDCQYVFVDAPGQQAAAKTTLHRRLNRRATEAARDADVALLVVEALRFGPEDHAVLAKIPATQRIVVAVNKIDTLRTPARLIPYLDRLSKTRDFAAIVPVSAKTGRNIPELLAALREALPEAPAIYPPDQLTDRDERFFAAEILREKIFEELGQELPYRCEVVVDSFKEEGRRHGRLRRIEVTILVERESQKPIVLGARGERLKRMASAARRDMEKLFGGKVYLGTWVKVRKAWTDDARVLRQLGYE